MLAFQILCILAVSLHPIEAVSANFVFWITYSIMYFAYLAISHCINKELSISIEDNNQIDGHDIGIKTAKKKVSLGVLIVLIFSVLVVLNIELNKEAFLNILTGDPLVHALIS